MIFDTDTQEWLRKAKASYGKESITQTHHVEGFSFATDGHRLHAVRGTNKQNEPPDLSSLADSMGDDYKQAIVNTEQLIEALQAGTHVLIRVYGETSPVEMFFGDRYALVMPSAGIDIDAWRPSAIDNKDNE